MKKLLPIGLLINAFVLLQMNAQYGPAGVGGEEGNELGKPVNSLWLRAHDLMEDFNEGEEVDEWPDFSEFENDAVFPEGRSDLELPVLDTDTLNGHAWLNFNGNTFLKVEDDPSLDGGAGMAIFIVVNRNAYGGYPDTEFGEQSLVTKRKHWNAWSHIPAISFDSTGLQHAYELRFEDIADNPDNDRPFGHTLTVYINGNLPDGSGQDVFTDFQYGSLDTIYLVGYVYNSNWGGTLRVNGEVNSRTDRQEGNPNPIYVGTVINSSEPVYIGAAELDPPGNFGDNPDKDEPFPEATEDDWLQASVAEVIIYKGELDSTSTLLIENYLATKYSLYLVDSLRYYTDSLYVHDLVGIGTETGGDIQDVTSGDALGLEMLNGSLDAPKEYFIAAHNGTENEYVTENIGVENMERWSRVWKMEKTGELDATISFNFFEAGLSLGAAAEYRILYRPDLESDFQPLEIAGNVKFKTLSFEIPNDQLLSGYYTVGHATPEVNNITAVDITNAIRIYPNPVNQNFINISVINNLSGNAVIRILDYTGKEISMYQESLYQGISKTLNVEHLPGGVYFLEISINNQKGMQPFLKE